jgi:SRSO17 transposase
MTLRPALFWQDWLETIQALFQRGHDMTYGEAVLCGFLRPFCEKRGHKKRRQMCPLCILGLIGPGGRKSIKPMAERFAPSQYDRLHHVISDGLWDAAPLETELALQADRIAGASDAFFW